MKNNPKRPASPSKPQNPKPDKMRKSLSTEFERDASKLTSHPQGLRGASGSNENGGAQSREHDVAMSTEGPPQWFRDFESRQEERFSSVFKECRELFESLKFEVDTVKEDVVAFKQKFETLEAKVDDLENRSRRCNLVIYNLPEGWEGTDCSSFISKTLKDHCNIDSVNIQRAHRTGKLNLPDPSDARPPKPHPIHIGFTFYQEKEKCRKALADLFKKQKFGDAKLFVANDFSVKVQRMRKEKLTELRRLRSQGKQAFFIYPATIKIRGADGRVRDP